MDATFSGLRLREGGTSFLCTPRNILQMEGTIQVEAPTCRNSGTESAKTSNRLGGPTGFCTPAHIWLLHKSPRLQRRQ